MRESAREAPTAAYCRELVEHLVGAAGEVGHLELHRRHGAASLDLGRVGPAHGGQRDGQLERVRIASDRASTQLAPGRTRPRSPPAPGTGGRLNSSANRAASRGVRRSPVPPTITGGCGCCIGLGSAGQSTSR